MATNKLRLRIFVTHPVQYHVPLWRAIAAHPDIDLKVFYFSDHSVRGGIDKGFGVKVAWDVDLLSGYENEFLARNSDLSRPFSVGIQNLSDLLRAERPDWIAISGYSHKFEQQLRFAAPRAGIKLLLRAELSDLSYGERPITKTIAREIYLRWFYRKIDRFCFPGEMGREHLHRFDVGRDKQFFSPYSVDDQLIERQRAGLDRKAVRKSLGVPDDCCLFLFSGKLIDRKDPMGLLDAFRHMQDRTHVGLVVLGDGELRKGFEAEAKALLGDRFIFPGFVNQSKLGEYFVAADAFVLPSKQETWGLVVNEAMHHSLPVIVSDRVGCHPDLIEKGVTGYVYPCGDSAAMARCMQELAQKDAAERMTMGVAAKKRIARYTIAESAKGVFAALGLEAP